VTYTGAGAGVVEPRYLSTDSEGHLLVADYNSGRILLLNSQLHLVHVPVDTDSKVKLRCPIRLCRNEPTSQLYVLHICGSKERLQSDIISVFSLTSSWLLYAETHSVFLQDIAVVLLYILNLSRKLLPQFCSGQMDGITATRGPIYKKIFKICPKIVLRCVLSLSYDIDLRSAKIIFRFS